MLLHVLPDSRPQATYVRDRHPLIVPGAGGAGTPPGHPPQRYGPVILVSAPSGGGEGAQKVEREKGASAQEGSAQ